MVNTDLQNALNKGLRELDIDQVKQALHAGAMPNRPSQNTKLTPMQVAAFRGFIRGLERLVEAGGDVNDAGHENVTPLMAAASAGHVSAGRWLLQHGADALAMNLFNQSALHEALVNKQFPFASMLVKECPLLREQNLIATAKILIPLQNFQIAQWLIEEGVSPNIETESGKPWLIDCQLHTASHSLQITKLLLHAGAEVNAKDLNGSTPLHRATLFKILPNFLALLHAGADPDLENRHGQSVRKILTGYRYGALKDAFLAWEASCLAHKVIQGTAEQVKINLL